MISELEKSQEETIKVINTYFKGRIFSIKKEYNLLNEFLKKPSSNINIKLNTNEPTNPPNAKIENKSIIEYYYIDNINFLSNSISFIKLYDKNDIKINIDYYIKNGFFSTILLDELFFNKSNINILSKEESNKILAEYNDFTINKNKFLKIFYSLNENLEFDNPDEFTYQQNINTNFFLRKNSLKQARKYNIEKIEPDNLSFLIDEYFIENNSEGLITDIKTKNENLKILFQLEEVKSEDKNKINYDKLPIGINLYFSLYKNIYLNIIHIDLIDPLLKYIKNIEIVNYNFSQNTKAYAKLDNSTSNKSRYTLQNVNLFKIKKFEDELIRQYYEKQANNDDLKMLILIRNLITRRVVVRNENGLLIEFRSEDFNVKKDAFTKIKIFDENDLKSKFQKQIILPSFYSLCFTKIINIPIVKLIDLSLFDINNLVLTIQENNITKDENNEPQNSFLNELKVDKDIPMPELAEYENIYKKNEKFFFLQESEPSNKDENIELNLNKSNFANKSLIDVQLVFDSNENYIDLLNSHNSYFYTEKDINICISPCLIEKFDTAKELELGKIILEKENIFKAEEMSLLKSIKMNLENYTFYFTDHKTNDNFNCLSAEEKQKLNKNITEDLQNMNKISFYIESKELWEYIEVIN